MSYAANTFTLKAFKCDKFWQKSFWKPMNEYFHKTETKKNRLLSDSLKNEVDFDLFTSMIVSMEWRRKWNRLCECCFISVETRPDGTDPIETDRFHFTRLCLMNPNDFIVVVAPHSPPTPTPFFGKRVLYLRDNLWRASARIRDRGGAPRHAITYGTDQLPCLFAFVIFQNEKLELACPRRTNYQEHARPKSSKWDNLCLSSLHSFHPPPPSLFMVSPQAEPSPAETRDRKR